MSTSDFFSEAGPWTAAGVVVTAILAFIRGLRRDRNRDRQSNINSAVEHWKTIAIAENAAKILAENRLLEYQQRERDTAIENARSVEIIHNLREMLERANEMLVHQESLACQLRERIEALNHHGDQK
jgi:hypothetical protein